MFLAGAPVQIGFFVVSCVDGAYPSETYNGSKGILIFWYPASSYVGCKKAIVSTT